MSIYRKPDGELIELTYDEYKHYPKNAKLTLVDKDKKKIRKKKVKEEDSNGKNMDGERSSSQDRLCS